MTHRPPTATRAGAARTPGRPLGLPAVAAAATPVVAAALIALAAVAAGCRSEAPPTGAPSPSQAPASTAPTAFPGGARLAILLGAPARPRLVVRDPATPAGDGIGIDLPAGADRLAAAAAASDGRLAVVAPDGRAWVTELPPSTGDPAAATAPAPAWVAVAGPPDTISLPGPILGATWASDGRALVLLAGEPGSGIRRAAIVIIALDDRPATLVEAPLEPDGPGIAALPDGVVAFVGRDLRDRATLARVTAVGTLATVAVAARAVVAGGDLVAVTDDAGIRLGTLAQLDQGILPVAPLALASEGGIGAVAIAGDGSALAVVRLDDDGDATRIDTFGRIGPGPDAWVAGPSLDLDPGDGTALPAWLP